MSKQDFLVQLEKDITVDTNLPLQESNLVFGEGNSECDVMFIGEAPGQKEDELRRPFVGRAGQLLTKMIEGLGWRREDVYITNIVKRRPPDNRDPFPDEIQLYSPYLTRQIEIISPALIVPLGRFSMNYFLPEARITRDQGKIFSVGGRCIFPMFHPAAALRNPAMMDEFVKTFRLLPVAIKSSKTHIAKKGAPR